LKAFYETIAIAAIRDLEASVSINCPWQPDCPVIGVSKGFEQMSGYSRSEVVGRNLRFLSSGCTVSAEERHSMRVTVRTGRAYEGLLHNRRKDGTLFRNLLHINAVRIGGSVYMVGVQKEIDRDNQFMDIHSETMEQVLDAIFAANVDAWIGFQAAQYNASKVAACIVPYAETMLRPHVPPQQYSKARNSFVSLEENFGTDHILTKNTFLQVYDGNDDPTAVQLGLRRVSSEPILPGPRTGTCSLLGSGADLAEEDDDEDIDLDCAWGRSQTEEAPYTKVAEAFGGLATDNRWKPDALVETQLPKWTPGLFVGNVGGDSSGNGFGGKNQDPAGFAEEFEDSEVGDMDADDTAAQQQHSDELKAMQYNPLTHRNDEHPSQQFDCQQQHDLPPQGYHDEFQKMPSPLDVSQDGAPVATMGSPQSLSLGSADHPDGCTPCSFFCYSLNGCNKGQFCNYCHIAAEHPRRSRRRRKRGGKERRDGCDQDDDDESGQEDNDCRPTGNSPPNNNGFTGQSQGGTTYNAPGYNFGNAAAYSLGASNYSPKGASSYAREGNFGIHRMDNSPQQAPPSLDSKPGGLGGTPAGLEPLLGALGLLGPLPAIQTYNDGSGTHGQPARQMPGNFKEDLRSSPPFSDAGHFSAGRQQQGHQQQASGQQQGHNQNGSMYRPQERVFGSYECPMPEIHAQLDPIGGGGGVMPEMQARLVSAGSSGGSGGPGGGGGGANWRGRKRNGRAPRT
jgi:PAS domain S-box-containing protein